MTVKTKKLEQRNLSRNKHTVLRTIVISLLFSLLLLSSNNLYADFCDDFPADPLCEDGNPDAPLDSGVGLLIGAAAFYTLKKIREKKETVITNTNKPEIG